MIKNKISDKLESKNLEEVWEWKDKLSDKLRGKSFKEVKKILDEGIRDFKEIIKS